MIGMENKDTTPQTADQQSAAPQEEQQSYAVRPERQRRQRIGYSDADNLLRVRNWLNIAFMALALVGVILWYTLTSRTVPTVILIVAVVIKIAEVCIRMFRK